MPLGGTVSVDVLGVDRAYSPLIPAKAGIQH